MLVPRRHQKHRGEKTMKRVLILATLAVMLAACANKKTVNILISNTSATDITNVAVRVPVEDILRHIDTHSVDSLILLNEKNQQVDFSLTQRNQEIEFIVPIVRARSQKNYSINIRDTEFSDNLFSFRTTSINISL